ncbi:tRNA-processing RNAse BN [Sulfurimonas denitrificans DSM 1251]|jgi:membrane protein|uniref:tRNA-processing RNAse BN n=1 Tax=Sulfurimonas denitrificans (strain ATCC 33889 / DSM 1251) TaxID=326298 RepID=Q30TM7_SULDN|nr:YihY family inner membrane protein [Sulfurimonas denitrificans]ABB43654.1 tRNA-processing RNAse BN [Sulfurimonas denitrificans DSM 1251]MDD3442543.1 YihY family inner membrane protein [Sulfurimonas denitrificans]
MIDIKGKFLKIYEYVKLFVTSFIDKDLTFYAASLSFYTIFTLIPLLLITLTLFTSMPNFADSYEKLQEFIFSNIMPVNSEAVMGHINGFLQNSLEMSMISFVAVIISSLLFFQNFEYIANKIFHVKKRGIWESITTFWTLLTLTPIGLGASFYITGYVASLMAENEYIPNINILPYIPYLIIWVLFFLIFQISANTKIDAKASLISSFITAIIFSIAKNGFIYYIFYNKSYATMYGSFSIVMILFLWIYASWIVFIYGLKLCYLINRVYENRTTKEK